MASTKPLMDQQLAIPEQRMPEGAATPESSDPDSGVTFSDRIRLVAGGKPFALAKELDIPTGTMTTWMSGAKPQRKSLQLLQERTGIPVHWWRHGAGEIPLKAARRFGLAPPSASVPVEAAEPAAESPLPPSAQAPQRTTTVDLPRLTRAMQIIEDLTQEANVQLPRGKFAEVASLTYEMLRDMEDGDRLRDIAKLAVRLAA